MSAMASAKASISAGDRGVSENCLPTVLSVVLIRSPARARLASRPRERLPHEGLNPRLPTPSRPAPRVHRDRAARRHRVRRESGLLAFRTDEGMNQGAQPFERRPPTSSRILRSNSWVCRHSSLWSRNRIAALFGKY